MDQSKFKFSCLGVCPTKRPCNSGTFLTPSTLSCPSLFWFALYGIKYDSVCNFGNLPWFDWHYVKYDRVCTYGDNYSAMQTISVYWQLCSGSSQCFKLISCAVFPVLCMNPSTFGAVMMSQSNKVGNG